MDTYTCEIHPDQVMPVGKAEDPRCSCPKCIAGFETRRKAETMTGAERAAEIDQLVHAKLSQPFPNIHKRVEELVGRPVYTHEFVLNFDGLLAEARGEREHATIEEILGQLKKTGKPVIVITKG